MISAIIAGPFQGSTTSLVVFDVASILKDSVDRLSDISDDGRSSDSFGPSR